MVIYDEIQAILLYHKTRGINCMERESKVHIAICDDKDIIVKKLHAQIQCFLKDREFEWEIHPFTDPLKLLQFSKPIQILFLDIDMPQMNGLKVAKEVAGKWQDVKIIFLTAYSEYMQNAFKVKTFRYLLKSFQNEEVKEALFEALDVILEKNFKLIKVDGKIIQINISDIYYVESLGDESVIYRENDFIISKSTLKEWAKENYFGFYRGNKDYIVNFLHVEQIKDKVLLTNGKELSIAVRKKRLIKEAYYLFKRDKARILWE